MDAGGSRSGGRVREGVGGGGDLNQVHGNLVQVDVEGPREAHGTRQVAEHVRACHLRGAGSEQ